MCDSPPSCDLPQADCEAQPLLRGALELLLRASMPPMPQWYLGKDEIRAFLIGGPMQSRWRFRPTTANGQLAFGTYLWDHAAGASSARSCDY